MNFRDRYGALDRIFHRIAFRLGTAQHALADVEEMLHGDAYRSIELDEPVFITALPRSGTSILLRLLHGTGRFACHTYRDMPFVLCPLLWNRFSRRFAVNEAPRERAHGDGLRVSADSPEAFEEIVWKRFWPEHYLADRIRPWTEGERKPEFDDFLDDHMRKIVWLRRDDPVDRRRYLSKNNLNLARLAALPRPLRRGVFVVLFREPVQHAASMLRQHRRFLRLHDEDGFVLEYMEAIGHHEFGRGLRPMDFGGWVDGAPDPNGLAFWIRYWIAAYGSVLAHAGERTVLVPYGALADEPERALARLAARIGMPGDELAAAADRIHPPRTHPVDPASVPEALLERASELHDRLRERAR